MKRLLRRRSLLVNGALAIVLVVVGGYAYLSLNDSAGASSPGRIVRVGRGTIVSSVSAAGSVISADSRALGFTTGGTVRAIDVQVGDKVHKGQVLASVDDAEAQDGVRSARAALNAAEAAGTSTPALYSAYVQAKASYNTALRQLGGTSLTAPISGTVIAINGTIGGSSSGSSSGSSGSAASGSSGRSGSSSTGSTSGSGTGTSASGGSGGFMTIADTSRLLIQGAFTEADVARLKKGQSATVTFDAMPGTQASGKVTGIDQTATTTNNVVQYGVAVSLTAPPNGLRIGATGTVRVTTAQADDVLYVPSAAVRTAGGRSTVTVLANGTQSLRVVSIGAQGDQGTEITSGLSEGDQVVIAIAGTSGTGFPSGRFPGGLTGGGVGGAGGGRGGGRG